MYCSTISQSKANVFNECKLKYRYRYVEKLKEESLNQDSLNFGSYIHKIFEDGISADSIEFLKELAKKYKKEYRIKNKNKDKTEICLKNFIKLNKKLNKGGQAELRYEILISEEISVNGIIDRIVKGDKGGYLIIDYKTGKREKNRVALYNDQQLQGYCFAVHKLYDIPIEDITVAHYYPVTDNLVSLQYSPAQISNYVKNKINEVWKIRKCKKPDLVPSENQFCNWCGFKELCPIFADPSTIPNRLDEAKQAQKKKNSKDNKKTK